MKSVKKGSVSKAIVAGLFTLVLVVCGVAGVKSNYTTGITSGVAKTAIEIAANTIK